MSTDLISKKTRHEFREFFVSTTLRHIEAEFDNADVPCATGYEPRISGARRSLVEQYYHSIDWSKWSDVRKILVVYGNVLASLETEATSGVGYDRGKQAASTFAALKKWLERDGFSYNDGKVSPVRGVSTHLSEVTAAAAEVDAPELHRQIERIKSSAEDDPRLAIGTAKELVETTCKTILVARGLAVDREWDLPRLVKETRKALKLLADDVPDSAKGAEAIRRLLSNLGAVGNSLGELRNLYGTGHGPHGKAKGLSPRHARLAVGAAATLATFLLETHEERS